VEEDLLFMATIQEMCNTTKANDSSWLIDSGCTNHMTADMSLFKDLDKSYLSRVRIGNGDCRTSKNPRGVGLALAIFLCYCLIDFVRSRHLVFN
jgi:hypothetical protein